MRKRKKDPKTRNDTSSKAKKTALKKAKTVRTKAPKTRNNGTMSDSEFWSFVRSALRNRTRFWKPRLKVLTDAKRPYVGPNKRQKFEYVCSHCKQAFPQTQIEVNHKKPCGTLKCGDDLKEFVENLFCESDGLEVVCKPCHKKFHKKADE